MLIGRRRRLALGVWLVCSVVVWNVVFDRGVESAEERYLHAPAAAAPTRGLRATMDPAIRHSAAVASACASAVFLSGAAVIIYLGRRRPRPRPPSPRPGQALSP
ncbi:MAG: hypothetical protein ACM3NQ_24240 [Bacteroidales bacterium]